MGLYGNVIMQDKALQDQITEIKNLLKEGVDFEDVTLENGGAKINLATVLNDLEARINVLENLTSQIMLDIGVVQSILINSLEIPELYNESEVE